MLISYALPQPAATQATNVASAQAAYVAASSAAASQPMTASAVNASVAARAYQPQTAERRPVQQQASTPMAAPTQGSPSILPNAEFWRVPDRQVDLPQPQAVQQQRTPPAPVQQTAPFIAQTVAQQAPEVRAQQQAEQPASVPSARKSTALPGKQPGVESSGFGAYAVASQRTIGIDLPTSVEAFA